MKSKYKSNVLNSCLEGVPVRAAVEGKKRCLFQARPKIHPGSQSTPDRDGHNDSRNEEELARSNDPEAQSSEEL